MKKLIFVFLLSPGCYWAQVHKKSVIDEYHCEWIMKENDVGPLQCVPMEDWAQENPVCGKYMKRQDPQPHEL